MFYLSDVRIMVKEPGYVGYLYQLATTLTYGYHPGLHGREDRILWVHCAYAC